ncbi:MAG: efflux RND transporter periplasmic adaptor subunit [Verrucomicrobia bacterium]|nr:efflux RND transporter periplasmic adaptor subunit [Verrucomicrobiota bacterium]
MEKKASARRIPSPEQLDRLLVIIHVPGWIALVCLMAIVAGIVGWAFLGRLPIFVEGKGVFFDPSSIYVVETDLNGRIEDIFVAAGDSIDVGSPLFVLKNPLKQLELQEIEKKMEFVERTQGINRETELFDLQLQKEAVEAYINGLTIRSQVSGIVLAINVVRGEFIQPNQNLAWLQKKASPTEKQKVFAVFATDAGALLHPGMDVHVAFKAIDSERYGKMIGVIEKILPFTGSNQGKVFQSLHSEEWQAMLLDNETQYIVVIDPELDPSTPSGYRWTSKEGPSFKVPPDALASVTVIVKEQRPIQYLIPLNFSK